MSALAPNTPSVTDRLRESSAPAGVVAAGFLGERAAFVLAEEVLLLVGPDGAEETIAAHAGGILSAASDGKVVLTGGDDGKVMITDAGGTPQLVAQDERRRWIDQVALGPDGAFAYSAGKTVVVQPRRGEARSLDVISTPGGLAFAPKGLRLAISHYNGASLWFPNSAAAPEILTWKGSHGAITVSPDGRYVVTAMQEPMLHGWRLEDVKHMRMSGYSAKVRSMAWSASGKHLATSGSEQLILWPFAGKDGPMGKQPRLLAPYPSRVATVACHPRQEVVAIGYADGLVLLVRIDDGAEIIARRPAAAPVTALAWSPGGDRLAIGVEDGAAAVLDLA